MQLSRSPPAIDNIFRSIDLLFFEILVPHNEGHFLHRKNHDAPQTQEQIATG